jgi:hypothetical protein
MWVNLQLCFDVKKNLVPLSCTRSGGGKIDTKSEAMAVYSFGCIVHLSGLSLPADLKY